MYNIGATEILYELTLERILEDIEKAKHEFEDSLRYLVNPSYEIKELANYIRKAGIKVEFVGDDWGTLEWMDIRFHPGVKYDLYFKRA